MKKFGLIGCSIAGAGSPALFNAAYGGKYPYDLLDGEKFAPLLERFRKDYSAVNITAPFKEEALGAADEMTDAAQLCGAANILIRMPGGRIMADNSDFEGVTLSLISAYAVNDEDADVDDEDAFAEYLSDKTALVVGCGGAGKAAAAAAVTLGFGKTIIMNRSVERAEQFKKHLMEYYEDLSDDEIQTLPLDKFAEIFPQADAVIYTLPCPIEIPQETGCPKIVLEANYKTPCFENVEGIHYVSGLNWLFNQAVVAYEAFTGIQPDEEAMKKVL